MEKKYIICMNGDYQVTEKLGYFEALNRFEKLYNEYKVESGDFITVLGNSSFATWVNEESLLFEIIELK